MSSRRSTSRFPGSAWKRPPGSRCSPSTSTWKQVLAQYEEMATRILERAISLRVPGIVLEFELLPAMTLTPEWGAEVTRLLESHLRRAHEKRGLRCALRVTP